MTHTDYTKDILNIKDDNIYFYENCLKNIKINNITTKVFHGYLTYIPKSCPKCGSINEGFDDIIKWNWKKGCKIKLPKVSNFNTLLILDKQRFYCKHCHSTFTASTNIVDFHKQVSNHSKTSIILELMGKSSELDISKRNNVSTNTVNRILHEISKDKEVKNNGHLPTSFGIDEFSATNDTISKMAFIIVSHLSKNIFDINNSRKSLDIEKYFRKYPRYERDKVEFITMDLYKPYYKLMHKLFKKAILIPDRFHIVIQFRNALDKTRIKLCKKSNKDYNKFKKYWKLLLKSRDQIDCSTWKKFTCFSNYMTEIDVVNFLVNSNHELKDSYEIYQNILYAIQHKDITVLKETLSSNLSHISEYMKTSIKSLSQFLPYIENSFQNSYHNGYIEGNNNFIKVLKRIAFGFRSFRRFKARILICKGLLLPNKKIVNA